MKALRLYLELAKARIVLLVLWTVGVGVRVGGGAWRVGALTLLGVGLAAAGAAMLNHWMDRDLDARMVRTRRRPLPSGRIRPSTVLLLGILHVLAGLGILLGVSGFATLLTALTVVLYTPLYTLHKRRSPHSAVIGSLIGAFPPAIGVVAVRGAWTVEATLLAALLFLWQPAHFWALAQVQKRDYRDAALPVLPLTHGRGWTDLMMVLYAGSLLPLVALFLPAGMVSPGEGVVIWGLTALLAGLSLGVLVGKVRHRTVFRFSTLYLIGVLLPLMV